LAGGGSEDRNERGPPDDCRRYVPDDCRRYERESYRARSEHRDMDDERVLESGIAPALESNATVAIA
jgi:hypothetical protein